MNHGKRILLGLWVGLVLGGAVALLSVLGLPPVTRTLLFWFGACLAGELLWVRLSAGAATISMASCFNFAALLVLAPRESMLVAGAATLLAELAVMRKPVVRAVYNTAQTMLAMVFAAWCFAALGGRSSTLIELVSSLRLLPLVAAAAAYYAVNRGAVVVVVALAESISLRESWHRNFGSTYDPLACGGAVSLGVMLAMQYGSLGMIGTLFIALPLVMACDGYRRFTRDSQAPAASPATESSSERRAA